MILNRREVIAGISLPLLSRAASAQPATIPVVTFVTPGHGAAATRFLDAIRRGLQEVGIVEGRGAMIEHRDVDGRLEQLPALIDELVRSRVAVICTITNVVALTVKAAHTEVPLVFAFGLDPVEMGLVATINRPGGNATGVFFPVAELEPKRLELLRELVPQLQMVAVLVNPANPNADMKQRDEAARRTGSSCFF
jgi:putative ABC transport system substrate-binding protein